MHLPLLLSQSFITFMDALKLKLKAKDQLHPILQELMTGYARFKGSKDWEGRGRLVSWYVICSNSGRHTSAESPSFVALRLFRLILLNGMKASEELSDEQSRQVRSVCTAPLCPHSLSLHSPQLAFDIDFAYAEFFRSLSGGSKESGT